MLLLLQSDNVPGEKGARWEERLQAAPSVQQECWPSAAPVWAGGQETGSGPARVNQHAKGLKFGRQGPEWSNTNEALDLFWDFLIQEQKVI